MLKIGITGGIGSGKTIVSRIFKHLGVPVYNADEESKKLVNINFALRQALMNTFGEEVYHNDQINKAYFADIIFSDTGALKKANSIIHPFVRADFEQWIQKNKNFRYVIHEAAILYESGAYKLLDKIIVVYAPETLRINRVTQRDGVKKEDVLMRIKNQMSDEEKKGRADFVIFNDDKQLVTPQVLKIHKQCI